MSDIHIGGWVMVVKPSVCCGYTGDLMKVFQVLDMYGAGDFPSTCNSCGESSFTTNAQEDADNWHDIRTLKPMPDVDELESVEREEEVTA